METDQSQRRYLLLCGVGKLIREIMKKYCFFNITSIIYFSVFENVLISVNWKMIRSTPSVLLQSPNYFSLSHVHNYTNRNFARNYIRHVP